MGELVINLDIKKKMEGETKWIQIMKESVNFVYYEMTIVAVQMACVHKMKQMRTGNENTNETKVVWTKEKEQNDR